MDHTASAGTPWSSPRRRLGPALPSRRATDQRVSALREPAGTGVPPAFTRRTMGHMGTALIAAVQRIRDLLSRRRPSHPPGAGVREPRRPRPTMPAAAIALAEPRTEV